MRPTSGGRITRNVEITAVQQRGNIMILNFGTKQMLSPRALESVPFGSETKIYVIRTMDMNHIIPGHIPSLIDTFPTFLVGLELK